MDIYKTIYHSEHKIYFLICQTVKCSEKMVTLVLVLKWIRTSHYLSSQQMNSEIKISLSGSATTGTFHDLPCNIVNLPLQ